MGRKQIESKPIESSAQELAYIAGFFDGGGCIHLRHLKGKPYHRVVLTASQVDRAPLALMEAALGGTITLRPQTGAGTKPIHRWTLSRYQQVGKVLEALTPYLMVKHAKALEALELMKKEGKYGE